MRVSLWSDFSIKLTHEFSFYRSKTILDGSKSVKPKLKCLGFTYNEAKLFNMLPIKIRKVEDPSAFKTMTKKWIWENIPSY